ncbi:MAG: PQQ-binding-like beta-propeller repeat protein [Pseudonocardia sp.]|nr:PQQ-binding-like beta-propeller repeat protein [Pseudonocardia sp.]
MLDRGPVPQIVIFEYLTSRLAGMRGPAHAQHLLAEGRRAIDNGRPERLRTINPQPRAQLDDETNTAHGLFSTVNPVRLDVAGCRFRLPYPDRRRMGGEAVFRAWGRRAVVMLAVLAGCLACGGPGEEGTPVGPVAPVAGAVVRLGADWPTYHGDNARAGFSADDPDPVNPAVAWQARLDGAVYASPIVVGQRVIAATEAGSLYALDAHTGAVLWRAHLADPVPGSDLPCGNIDPIGITGTPAYDPSTDLVFAVATQAGVVHTLYGVDAASGQVRQHRPADAPGSDPATHLQRGALLVSGGMVYVPYGGNYGDCGQYLGRVVALPVSGTGPMLGFAVPTTREAGMWAPPGATALPAGDLLVTTGNGEAVSGDWDHSDSVLRLSPTLELRDGFAPTEWAEENSEDADLGSTGPVLLPGARQVVAAGKGGGVYLADVDALGGVGGQRAKLSNCQSYGGGAATPGSGGASVAYLPCESGLLQVLVGPGDRMAKGWQAPKKITGSPVVVGRTVWSVQRDGTMYALDARDGRQLATVPVGAASRFATPAVSGSALFVPTLAGVTAVAITR